VRIIILLQVYIKQISGNMTCSYSEAYSRRRYCPGLGWRRNKKYRIQGRNQLSASDRSFVRYNRIVLYFLGLDYTFDNSLALQAEALYNQFPEGQSGKTLSIYTQGRCLLKSFIYRLQLFCQGELSFYTFVQRSLPSYIIRDQRVLYRTDTHLFNS